MFRIVLAFFFVALPALPNVIDFDSLANGDVVTNQFTGVVFSSTSGFANFVTAQASYNGTPPNFLCTGPAGGGINCTQETILDFLSPVSGLTFQGMGINDVSANVAQVDVYVSGLLNSTVTIPGNAEGLNPSLVDLSGFSNVTRIRIYNITDGGGIGWDTFTFNGGAAGVPEPGTFLTMGVGLLSVLLAGRRRLAKR